MCFLTPVFSNSFTEEFKDTHSILQIVWIIMGVTCSKLSIVPHTHQQFYKMIPKLSAYL